MSDFPAHGCKRQNAPMSRGGLLAVTRGNNLADTKQEQSRRPRLPGGASTSGPAESYDTKDWRGRWRLSSGCVHIPGNCILLVLATHLPAPKSERERGGGERAGNRDTTKVYYRPIPRQAVGSHAAGRVSWRWRRPPDPRSWVTPTPQGAATSRAARRGGSAGRTRTRWWACIRCAWRTSGMRTTTGMGEVVAEGDSVVPPGGGECEVCGDRVWYTLD